MAMQGSDTSALRKSATGLRYSGTALSGIAITYETMAAWMSASKTDAANATKWRQMAKNYQQLGGSMITLAGTLDEQAAKQDAASSAAGFTPPVLTIPQVPSTGAFDPPPVSDPIVDSPLPGPSPGNDVSDLPGLPGLPGGAPDDLLGSTDDAIPGIGDTPGGAGPLGEAFDPTADNASDSATAGQEGDQRKSHAEGPLNLLPGGSAVNVAVAGVAAAAVAGIAASVLRRRKPKNKDDWEDEERDGDDVEAVYQAEPRQRPAAG